MGGATSNSIYKYQRQFCLGLKTSTTVYIVDASWSSPKDRAGIGCAPYRKDYKSLKQVQILIFGSWSCQRSNRLVSDEVVFVGDNWVLFSEVNTFLEEKCYLVGANQHPGQ